MPVPGLTVLAATLLCGLLGGCVSSGGTASPNEAGAERVASGKPTFLQQTYMTMDRRCRPVKRPTGVLTEPPRHGKVRMATKTAKAEYGPGEYRHCDGKPGPSLAFEYTSRPGYRGPDQFGVRVRYSDGEIRQAQFKVEVD
ncbi:conserved exported hypothetical protein [Hyphomicrobiales bacterium]|nr:conserved exported hypothetical protein [Hyphomicrobiales bacterium]CAH1697901.1 conserved exported hypothetical protein [Hyphomicrobiales bacterium]CAI0347547.1 conserved exported hypothetical protein [Hyphomicrobiales bacterium]